MKTWDEHLRTLRSRHPRLGDMEGKVALADAYRELLAEERWTFLAADSLLTTEEEFTSGTVEVTTGLTAITFTQGAEALPWDPTWKHRRIRIDGRDEVYRVAITGAGTGTLTPAWQGESDSGLSFVMFRSVYEMPDDCDYGRELVVLDPANSLPMTMLSMVQMRHAAAYVYGQTGTPEAIARVELYQSSETADPVQMMEFGPTAPAGALSYPVHYFRKMPAITNGDAKPLWPEDFESLITERAEIKLEENPRHNIVLSKEWIRKHHAKLWELKKRAGGGVEIFRQIQLIGQGGRCGAMNVRLGSGGYNPMTGES